MGSILSRGLVLAAFMLLGSSASAAAAPAGPPPGMVYGPVFDHFGPVFAGVQPSWTPDVEVYKAVFNVTDAPDAKDQRNQHIESLARFMNLNARAGVPVANMHLALVLHGAATRAVLKDDAYRKRYKTDNPDRELMQALADQGVLILVCGQAAKHFGFAQEEMLAPVQVSLSAMTALVGLQEDGYRLIP